MERADELRRQIRELTGEYYREAFARPAFVPGRTRVPVAGRVFDEQELERLVDASLDFWLTDGRFSRSFVEGLQNTLGVRFVSLCNSGSSANLLAVSALTSPVLGDSRLREGDEVITVAAGFPTTVNPLLQNRLVPVFVDIELSTYNVDVSQLEAAVSPRTRGIMLAHTLGNPFDLRAVVEFARRYKLWLIEDNCDALGSKFAGRWTGTFGDLATLSFYPAHHITTGEGGSVLTSNAQLNRLVDSFRDWGRACWCPTGEDNTCGKRFGWQLGELPSGYDHKYTYNHVGYNLKLTDMQAAVGAAQLGKLTEFTAARQRNWNALHQRLQQWRDWLLLPRPTAEAEPSWFGFALTVKETAPFSRLDLVRHLEERHIATRQLFAGNLVRQPAYRDAHYRVVGKLANTDVVMHRTFWIGVYPGLTPEMIGYMADSIDSFCAAQVTAHVA